MVEVFQVSRGAEAPGLILIRRQLHWQDIFGTRSVVESGTRGILREILPAKMENISNFIAGALVRWYFLCYWLFCSLITSI
jgi:hypothetical protein